MAWTTSKFIEAFFESKLGRKRVHGTYRVLEGDHCMLLVRAITEYGRPAGSHLVAINFEVPNQKGLAFWSANGTRAFTYRMARRLETDRWQQLPSSCMDSECDALAMSGVVEIDDDHALIEIGDAPWLMHRKHVEGVRKPGYEEIVRVPKRVSTILEALILTKDPDGQVLVCDAWWAEPQDDTFRPPPFDVEAIKTMAVPLNPLEYGFTMDEVRVETHGYGSDETGYLLPMDKFLATPLDTRARQWCDARSKWRAASKSWENRKPAFYEGLSTQAQRYNRSSVASGSGSIIRTGQGVYVTGLLHSLADWNKTVTLNKWHKLMSPSHRMQVTKG